MYTHDVSVAPIVAPIAQLAKDRHSDAGGPGFESQAGRVTGKSTPSLWRDKHPAIKGLRPPEHHAGQFLPDQIKSSQSKKNITMLSCYDVLSCMSCIIYAERERYMCVCVCLQRSIGRMSVACRQL